MKALVNGIILAEEGELHGAALLFDERIRGIVPADQIPDVEQIDAGGLYICPGLVDVHIHGYWGEDVSDGQLEGLRKMARGVLQNGVTSFLPTTMTVSRAEILRAFAIIRHMMPESQLDGFDGSQILGCHAEGPFINPARKGAQSAEHILPPDASLILDNQDVVRIVTMAPEMPGALDFIRQITDQTDVLISIGHTSASYDQAMAAIRAGAGHITHLFNAMTGLNHRDPGVVGAALGSPVSCELIADGFHIHPGLFSFLHSAKGDQLVLVTDCTRAGGLPDGEYSLGGQPIYVKGIECRLADGTIAGSVLHLNDAVRNLYRHGGVTRLQAVHAASLSPARAIGADKRKGSIRAGKDADLVLMDDNFEVTATYVRGVRKYIREA